MSRVQMNLFPSSIAAVWQEIIGNRQPKHIALYDRTLFSLVVVLLLTGFVIVASASMPEGQRLTDNPFHFMQRHMFYIAGCMVILAVGLQVPMAQWQKYSSWTLLAALLLLILVMVAGKTVNGSTRWLAIGPINIQVSEMAKLAFFSYLAAYIVRRHGEVIEQAKGFFKPFGSSFYLRD